VRIKCLLTTSENKSKTTGEVHRIWVTQGRWKGNPISREGVVKGTIQWSVWTNHRTSRRK